MSPVSTVIAAPGQAAIRAGLRDFLVAANLPGVGAIFLGPPRLVRGSDALAAPTDVSGAAIYLHIGHASRVRRAFGGQGDGTQTSGKKLADYQLTIVVLYRSNAPDRDEPIADYDAIIDGIVAAIENDRTLGIPGLIYSAGEDDGGIVIDADLPRQGDMSGTYHLWTSIQFSARGLATV